MKFILCLSLLAVVALSHGSFSKVSSGLRKTMMTKKTIDVLVMIDEIDSVLASVTARYTKATTHGEKAVAVNKALTAHAARTQKSTLEFLSTKKNAVKSYWVNNMIWVEGADHALIMALAARSEVSEILEDGIVTLNDQVVDQGEFPTNKQNMEWGVRTVRAPEAWATTAGAGAIVGVIDTGARHTHTMINHSYMGNDAAKFAWFNPYNNAHATPNDGHGHGTHVTGTIAGNNGIGVAHEAKWISCKGLNDQGSGTNANLIACFQFMACPHHHSGTGGGSDCTQAPHLVSNSWGSSGGNTAFNAAINTWHAADIWPVFAAGNSGSSCSTIGSPADSVSGTISVGATAESEGLASFSSKGPVRQTEINPHVSAPGQNVRSAGITSDTAFATMSGTSMACPHAAGVLALMQAHNPALTYATAKTALQNSSNKQAPVGSGQTCGGIADNVWPNNSFGHGRIDAVAALAA
jgi:subtilisin family serine protease